MSRRTPFVRSPLSRSATLVVLAAIGLLGTTDASALTITVEAAGGDPLVLDESDLGCETSGDLMLCGDQADPESISGTWSGPDYDLMISGILADPDPIITIGFGFTNTGGATQTFTVTTSLPIPALASPVQIAGSAGFTISDGTLDSAALGNDTGTPIFEGLIDGAVVGSAGDPFSLSCTSSGILPCTATDSVAIAVETLAQGAANSIGMSFRFTLTPGDSIGVSGSFVVEAVPEPGVGLLLGTALATLGWAPRKGRHAARR